MCAFVVNVPLKIEASRELEARLKESERTGPSTPTISPPASFASFCLLFPRVLGEFRSASRVANVSRFPRHRPAAAATGPRSRSCGVPLYFHFRCFPRGAVSPYIYLIAPPDPQSRSTIPPSAAAVVLSPHLHTVGRAYFAPPLYGQFPTPL